MNSKRLGVRLAIYLAAAFTYASAYAVLDRQIPTTGPNTFGGPTGVASLINEELAQLYLQIPQTFDTTSGTNTYTASTTPNQTAYADGNSYWFKPPNTNTSTTVTLNIDGLGARNMTDSQGNTLAIGELQSSTIYLIRYFASLTQMRVIAGNEAAGAPTTPSYLTLATDATLTSERTLAVTAPITATDGGAGNALTLALASNGITNALIRQSIANSVVGRANNSTGDVGDIQATVDGTALRLSGTTLGFGTLAASAYGANTVGDAAIRQGVARSVIGRSANSTGNVADIVGGGAGTFLQDTGAALAFTAFTTISADFNLTGDITPATITATQNNYTPTGLSTATILKLSSDASRSITGLTGGADGRILIISNVGNFDIILENEDAGSTAANRFAIGGDVTLTAGNSATLFYDAGTSRWRLSSDTIKAAAGGGEANTASNVNAGGTGVFVSKVGVDLRFRGINTTAGAGISVVNDSGNNEIDLALDITGLTEDTTPDQAADFAAVFDTSAAGNKKVKLEKIGAGAQQFYVDAAGMLTETTSGCVDGTTETTTNQVMYASKDCDAATQEGVQFKVGMPKSANETTVTARINWTTASGTGDVIWLVSCLARSDDDPIDTAFGTEISVTDTVLTAGDVHLTADTAAITPGGTWAENDVLWCRIQRDADAGGDTLGVDVKLLGARFTYTTTVNTDN